MKRQFIPAIPDDFELEVNSIMNIRPLYDRIVVKRIEEQETTRNGIVIPDSAKEKPQEGEVMAIGQGKRLDDGKLVALDVKVGDRILFGKYSGNEIKLDGTEYIIMREDDVLGVLDAAAASGLRKPARSKSESTRKHPWQNRLLIATTPVRRSCAASTNSPTR